MVMVLIYNGKSVRNNGALDSILNELKLAGVDTVIFDRVNSNPVLAMIV